VAAENIKVACIGDSITFGVGAKDRKTLSYPAQLQEILGEKYEVMNCGKSGIKMTNYLKGWKQRITDFQPDIVTIKLGTNDTKSRKFDPPPGNKEAFNEAFSNAASELITFLRGLESKPKIYICLPVPVFIDKWGINEKALVEDVIPALNKLAKEKDIPVIDLYTPCKGKDKDVPDGVHPNEKIYAILADAIAKAIKQD
jgi:lysophospholipase L1-like esterase